ncbi:YczE/YyaS/YitT family protein [Priestia taiwanensis]|uniref:Permease n=1 Tax=Priestia taiwanensis TaxID=1347902 RepID=A0A917AWE2_9BACI|nr:YitT family protein [Priestia taiwanensis]MBM7365015.1 putative membrane protein YczE [Priestia taiwanensis]GGE83381.1 permease [Priestia taiwanensis]
MKYEYMYFIGGLLILALGINIMTTVTEFGLSPYDSLFIALYENFGISIGFWMFGINFVFVIIVYFLNKKFLTVGTIVTMFLISFFVDFVGSIDSLMASIEAIPGLLAMALGNICVGVGIGIYVSSNVCAAPQEAFVLAVSTIKKWTFRKTEIFLACLFLSVSFLLDGPIYFGTIVLSFTTGYIIQAAIQVGNVSLSYLKKEAVPA